MNRKSKKNLNLRKTLTMKRMLRRVTWTYPGSQILTKCIPQGIWVLKTLMGMNCCMPEEAVMALVMIMTVIMMVMMMTAAEKRRRRRRRKIRITCKKLTIAKFPFKDSLRNTKFEY
jgi:hypothetical protein